MDDGGITIAVGKKPEGGFQQPASNAPGDSGITGKSLEAALKRAKQNGTLSLQARGLKVFPMEIVNFQDLNLGENWWDGFDLNKVDLS